MTLNLRIVALAAATILGASACGQKGPLFLPGNPSQINPEPPADEQEEDEEGNEQPR